jgi:sugar phosphate isomerase/epimerase
MKISVNTWVYGADTDIEEIFKKVHAQGYLGVEVYGRDQEVNMSGAEAQKIKELAKKYDLELVTCCADTGLLPPDLKRNLASMDKSTRERAIEHCMKGIDHTARLGSHMVVLCVGKLEEGQTEEQAMEMSADSYKRLVPYAKERDVCMIIENFPDRWIGPSAKLKELCERVGAAEYCKGMVDTGHELVLGNTLEGAVKTLGKEYMGHLHLDNNNGVIDNHDSMSNGKLTDADFASLARAMKEIGYDGWYSFELYGTDVGRDADKVLSDSKACFERSMANYI